MANALKLYTSDSNGVTYADPLDPSYQVRFKFSSNRKNLNGTQVDNHITEIIYSDLSCVSDACNPSLNKSMDTLSVRLRISGSTASVDQLKKIIADMAAQVNTWTAEDILIGFRPTTVPSRTTE